MGEIVLPDIMKESGVEPKGQRHLPEPGIRSRAQVSQLKSQPTDLIGVGSGPEAATRLVQEMRRQGHKGRLVAGSTIADPELPKLMGKAGDGTVIPTAFYAGSTTRRRSSKPNSSSAPRPPASTARLRRSSTPRPTTSC